MSVHKSQLRESQTHADRKHKVSTLKGFAKNYEIQGENWKRVSPTKYVPRSDDPEFNVKGLSLSEIKQIFENCKKDISCIRYKIAQLHNAKLIAELREAQFQNAKRYDDKYDTVLFGTPSPASPEYYSDRSYTSSNNNSPKSRKSREKTNHRKSRENTNHRKSRENTNHRKSRENTNHRKSREKTNDGSFEIETWGGSNKYTGGKKRTRKHRHKQTQKNR